MYVIFFSEIEMENIDDASEISDVSHINKVCQLLEVICVYCKNVLCYLSVCPR